MTVLAFGGSATRLRFVPSNSKNIVGVGQSPAASPAGPATHSTRPLGSRQPGASLALSSRPEESAGKLGPATHVPVPVLLPGGVYSAVRPVAPTVNTRPSGSNTAGPISMDDA